MIDVHPLHHAISSARRHGGAPENYIHIHNWFDESKEHVADFRHRALRHHTQGIFECEQKFGYWVDVVAGVMCSCGFQRVFKNAALWEAHNAEAHGEDGEFEALPVNKQVPVRWIAEQHVKEDLGRIPTLGDWIGAIKTQSWMRGRSTPGDELVEALRKLKSAAAAVTESEQEEAEEVGAAEGGDE